MSAPLSVGVVSGLAVVAVATITGLAAAVVISLRRTRASRLHASDRASVSLPSGQEHSALWRVSLIAFACGQLAHRTAT